MGYCRDAHFILCVGDARVVEDCRGDGRVCPDVLADVIFRTS